MSGSKKELPAGSHSRPQTRYFSATGSVVHYPDHLEVFVGGFLIASFLRGDKQQRDLAIVAVTRSGQIPFATLGKAWGMSGEAVRVVARRFEEEGLEGVLKVRKKGRARALTPKLTKQLYGLFDDGLTIDEAHRKIRKRVSRAVVGRCHKQWVDAGKKARAEQEQREREESAQLTLDAALVKVKSERRSSVVVHRQPEVGASRSESKLDHVIASGGSYVQHVGSWIMLAMLEAMGLYCCLERIRDDIATQWRAQGKRFVAAAAVRAVVDAVVVALCIGQKTVEGVRRVATPTAPMLLRHEAAVSPSWARSVLGRLAAQCGILLHHTLATMLVQHGEGQAKEGERVVFYVDNHLRPYTGKFTIRKGWRMQAKRACPGNADYWVHDEGGRPVLRVNSPEHESLVKWLRPIGKLLRGALRDETHPVLLVFDRAGAFPGEMAALRDAGFEFATYERKPYRTLPGTAFDRQWMFGNQRLWFTEEGSKNLKQGRGRVRRIVVLMDDGEQVNILAVSKAPAEDLIAYMLARWSFQENQFKHGVERWGINQLDGRSVHDCPPDAVIPNPARRRLERALRIARTVEAESLRKLAHLDEDKDETRRARKRERLQRDLARARAEQQELKSLLPHVPKRAPVRETELADKLMAHSDDYKLTVDTIRIALANAETELAARLGPHLPRVKEAKKTLANLLSAPGVVRLHKRTTTITLMPAGTRPERLAFGKLLAQLNALNLTLPGDLSGRRLRFRIQIERDG